MSSLLLSHTDFVDTIPTTASSLPSSGGNIKKSDIEKAKEKFSGQRIIWDLFEKKVSDTDLTWTMVKNRMNLHRALHNVIKHEHSRGNSEFGGKITLDYIIAKNSAKYRNNVSYKTPSIDTFVEEILSYVQKNQKEMARNHVKNFVDSVGFQGYNSLEEAIGKEGYKKFLTTVSLLDDPNGRKKIIIGKQQNYADAVSKIIQTSKKTDPLLSEQLKIDREVLQPKAPISEKGSVPVMPQKKTFLGKILSFFR